MMKVTYGIKTESPVREAVRGIVLKGDSIGIIKVHKYDCYIVPGGGIDPGEDILDALRREMQEEAGLLVEVEEKLLTTETFELDKTHINHFYLCKVLDEVETNHTELELDLDIEFRWIKLSELYDYYLNYEDDLRFGEGNKIVQRSIKSRGFLLLSLLNNKFNLGLESRWLGKVVDIEFDRPVGYQAKPEHNPYPINYGFINNIYSLDGAEVDCYYLDSNEPLKQATGKVVAVVKRYDDIENKLVVSNENHSEEEIKGAIDFIEQYFDSIIITR